MVTLTDIEVAFFAGVYCLLGYDSRGAEYVHYYAFDAKAEAEALLARVEAAGGKVNPDHWAYRAPYGSQAWEEDGCEEALAWEERYGGLGEGDELAHVW